LSYSLRRSADPWRDPCAVLQRRAGGDDGDSRRPRFALSVKHISKRWSGFSAFARRAPYASGGLMVVIALYMGISGWIGLSDGHLPQV
jgi:hypothetical protein